MAGILLALAVAIYFAGLLISAPAMWSSVKSVKGDLRLIAFAWAAVFIGQGQMFAQDMGAVGFGGVQMGALYQLAWMAVGVSLILIAFIKVKIRVRRGSLAITGLAVYAFVGVAGAMFSPSPALSIYKAGQILMDVVLVLLVLSVVIKMERPRVMLELSYFLLMLVLASAALGGVLWPEMAFTDIEGAFTGVLRSYYPQVHFNELGLLSAVMLIASVRRSLERGTGALRVYWFGAGVLAATVLFYAQARTSLAAFALSLIVMSIFIPRLRLPAFVGVLVVGGWLASQWLSGGIDINLEGSAMDTYLRRGASDEQIESMSGRLGLWTIGWEMFKDAPIFGHGMDAGVRFGGVAYGLASGTNMHSAHMQILVNNGVVGYLAWLVFIFGVVYAIRVSIKRLPDGMRSEEGRLNLELALVAFVILFRSVLGHVLVTHHFSFLLFLAVFIYVVAPRSDRLPAPHPAVSGRGTDGNILARRRRSNTGAVNN